MFLLFYTVLAVLTVIYCLLKWRYGYWKRRGIHQFEPEFFFGNTRSEVMGKKSSFTVYAERYHHLRAHNLKEGGDYSFFNPVYIPADVDIIKNIMQKDFDHFTGHGKYHHPRDILSMHLFNMDGETWRMQRGKVSSTFTSAKIRSMFPILIEKMTLLRNIIDDFAVNHRPIHIKELVARFNTDIISSCAFGIESHAMTEQENDLRKNGMEAMAPGLIRYLLMEAVPSWMLAWMGFKGYGTNASTYFPKVVMDTMKYRKENGILRKDFMELLIELKNNDVLNDQEIVAHCFLFFIAGFETSSTTMMYVMYELSVHQDIQDILRSEITEVMQEYDGDLKYEAVMKMTYMDKVINETLRKYPPVATLTRLCNKNYTVPLTGTVIEKGTKVIISVWGIHKDPEYYPNPETFDPDNFSDKNKADRCDFSFLPFGEGPRVCLGLRFGILQVKVGIIAMIQKYKFTLNEVVKDPLEMAAGNIVLTVKNTILLDATKI